MCYESVAWHSSRLHLLTNAVLIRHQSSSVLLQYADDIRLLNGKFTCQRQCLWRHLKISLSVFGDTSKRLIRILLNVLIPVNAFTAAHLSDMLTLAQHDRTSSWSQHWL